MKGRPIGERVGFALAGLRLTAMVTDPWELLR